MSSFFQKSTSVQAKSITVTEMRYVRTRKGLSPAPVNLVTREMGKSVNVNISVEHAIIAFSAFNLLVLSPTHFVVEV